MIRGMLFDFAIDESLSISLSVNTLPLGLVGLDTHIAAISFVIVRFSKSTRYLNDVLPISSISPGIAVKRLLLIP